MCAGCQRIRETGQATPRAAAARPRPTRPPSLGGRAVSAAAAASAAAASAAASRAPLRVALVDSLAVSGAGASAAGGVSACGNCTADELLEGGVWLDAWLGAHGPRGFSLAAAAALALPNDAAGGRVLNDVAGAVAVLRRGGGVPLATKVAAAAAAGAVGALVVDDGACGDDFACGAPLGSRAGAEAAAAAAAAAAAGAGAAGGGAGSRFPVALAGFAAGDDPEPWARAGIPHALLSASAGARLLALLPAGALSRRRFEGAEHVVLAADPTAGGRPDVRGAAPREGGWT